METVIAILAIYGLIFAVKETDGPWGMMNWIRRQLFSTKYLGVFFFNLITCPYCCGCWAGLAIYFLTQESYKWNWATCWFLAGGVVGLIIDGILSQLHRQ